MKTVTEVNFNDTGREEEDENARSQRLRPRSSPLNSQLLLMVSHKFKLLAANLKRDKQLKDSGFIRNKSEAPPQLLRTQAAPRSQAEVTGPSPWGGSAEGVVAPTPPLSGLGDGFSRQVPTCPQQKPRESHRAIQGRWLQGGHCDMVPVHTY